MARFTEQVILSAFEKMLQEMPFDSIRVSELTRRCDISPNTFYYHYSSINDLLDYWLRTKVEHGLAAIPRSLMWKDRLKYVVGVCRANGRILFHLSDSKARIRLEQYAFEASRKHIEDTLDRWLGESDLPPARRQEIVQFMQYAFLGFFIRLLWDRMPEDVDQSIDWLERQFYLYTAQVLSE